MPDVPRPPMPVPPPLAVRQKVLVRNQDSLRETADGLSAEFYEMAKFVRGLHDNLVWLIQRVEELERKELERFAASRGSGPTARPGE